MLRISTKIAAQFLEQIKNWCQKQKFPIWESQMHNNVIFVLKLTRGSMVQVHLLD